MKISGLLLLAGLAVVSASPQGFFGGLRNLFRGGRQQGRGAGGGGGGRGRGSSCNISGPNYRGRYLVSWKGGCTKFTQSEGAAFCRSVNMRPISLDSPAKEQEFADLVQRDGQKYFWTGGKVNHGNRPSISWPNRRTTTSNLWSDTGALGVRQPDNREGNENCLAVLNNFYSDGVRFHDVACSHKKPIICE